MSSGNLLVTARLKGGAQIGGRSKIANTSIENVGIGAKGILNILNAGGMLTFNPNDWREISMSATVGTGMSGSTGVWRSSTPPSNSMSPNMQDEKQQITQKLHSVYGVGVSIALGSRWVYRISDDFIPTSPSTYSSVFDWHPIQQRSCDIITYSLGGQVAPDLWTQYFVYALQSGKENLIAEMEGAQYRIPLSGLLFFNILKKFLGLDLTLSIVRRTERELTDSERAMFGVSSHQKRSSNDLYDHSYDEEFEIDQATFDELNAQLKRS